MLVDTTQPSLSHMAVGVNMSALSVAKIGASAKSILDQSKTNNHYNISSVGIMNSTAVNNKPTNISSMLLQQLLTSYPSANVFTEAVTPGISHRSDSGNEDSSIIVKISLLLVITAFVLVASYKFVVHLFVGYSDRKDDVVTDGYSDEEDSSGNKRHHGPILDIG